MQLQLMFTLNIRLGMICDFDCGMIVGARQAGLSVSETADLLGFSQTTVSRVYSKIKKHPASSGSADGNALLMREVRGERLD